ncbi:MAG: hypothetical protein AAFQ58_08285 [Pseudomonadota bacterium]
MLAVANIAEADDLNAGAVVNKMTPEDQYTFVAGIVEGLAHARFASDGHTDGRSCIYKWFYTEDKTPENIQAAFARFPEHLPGAVVAAMITRRCGT